MMSRGWWTSHYRQLHQTISLSLSLSLSLSIYIYSITSDITQCGVTSDKPVKDVQGMVDITLHGVTSDKPVKDG